MIVNILREGGSNIERSGGALGHGSSLQEMKTAVGSCCPCPGCNELMGRYGQDEDGSGILPLCPGCKQAQKGASCPPSLSHLGWLATGIGMVVRGHYVVCTLFIYLVLHRITLPIPP